MSVRRVTFFVACTGVCFAGADLSRAQEAASASLPDQFQTGEMIQIQKPKKKKAESSSPIVATAPKQNTAPVPEQMPAAEEAPTHIVPEEKKAEPTPSTASMPPSQKLAAPTERATAEEEPEVIATPAEKKTRSRKRQRPAVQARTAIVSEPVPMSFSVAQSMATTAPLPEYTYEMKRRNLSGSGVCVVTVDPATGTVTNATMVQSTNSPLLDKLTTQTFKSWRFKPGTVSEVRVPISYE
jgi:TonB family protein